MNQIPKIAIIGGGPGGLTLGLLLHRHNIPFTIYERRSKPTDYELSRPSGMLDLHPESGILALKHCGVYDDFLPLTGECSQDFLVADRNGTILYNANDGRGDDGNNSRPEISRNNLLKLLLLNLPAERIKWGYKLVSASRSSSSSSQTTITLVFNPSSSAQQEEVQEEVDLVIGADGAWSKVRNSLSHFYHNGTHASPVTSDSQLTAVRAIEDKLEPRYSGMQIITLTIRDISTKHPHLSALLGTGSFTSLGNKHAVISQRGPADSARLYLWLSSPNDEDFLAAPSGSDSDPRIPGLKETLLTSPSLFGTFGPVIKELIATAFDSEEMEDEEKQKAEIRPLYALPFLSSHAESECHPSPYYSWPHVPGITLLGDAAHLMLPNGEGVNAAMLDALLLVNSAIVPAWREMETSSLTANGSTTTAADADEPQKKDRVEAFNEALDPLLKESEEKLAQRAREIGKETEGMISIMFGSDDAAVDFVQFFKGLVEGSGSELPS